MLALVIIGWVSLVLGLTFWFTYKGHDWSDDGGAAIWLTTFAVFFGWAWPIAIAVCILFIPIYLTYLLARSLRNTK